MATSLLEQMIEEAEEIDVFNGDDKCRYFTFDEEFERALMIIIMQPPYEVESADIPYAVMYKMLGSLQFENQDYLGARETLRKAIRWNPASCPIIFEYMETFKATGDMEAFGELAKELFRYAYQVEDVGRCYRNLGYYLIEIGQYKAAMFCMFESMRYEADTSKAMQELQYINQETGMEIEELNENEKQIIIQQYEIPVQYIEENAMYAFEMAKHYYKDGYTQMGDEFKNIAVNLGYSCE